MKNEKKKHLFNSILKRNNNIYEKESNFQNTKSKNFISKINNSREEIIASSLNNYKNNINNLKTKPNVSSVLIKNKPISYSVLQSQRELSKIKADILKEKDTKKCIGKEMLENLSKTNTFLNKCNNKNDFSVV